MPNKLFFLMFPFIVWTTLPLCFGSSCFFCLEFVPAPSHPLPPPFLLWFYLNVSYPVFRVKFLFQIPWSLSLLSHLIDLFFPWNPPFIFSPFVWNLIYTMVSCYICFSNTYTLLFSNDFKYQEDPWLRSFMVQSLWDTKKNCSFLVVVFFLVLILLAWKSWSHRVLL